MAVGEVVIVGVVTCICSNMGRMTCPMGDDKNCVGTSSIHCGTPCDYWRPWIAAS